MRLLKIRRSEQITVTGPRLSAAPKMTACTRRVKVLAESSDARSVGGAFRLRWMYVIRDGWVRWVLTKSLVTCNAGNVASARVIEKCSGVRISDASTQDGVEWRYWIATAVCKRRDRSIREPLAQIDAVPQMCQPALRNSTFGCGALTPEQGARPRDQSSNSKKTPVNRGRT